MINVYYSFCKVESKDFLFRILSEKYSLHQPHIESTKNGKPFLGGSDLHYNLTHSSNFIAIAFSETEVGIDCEKIRKRNISALYNRLSLREQADIEDVYDFLEHWIIKESYIKKHGLTLAHTLNRLEVVNRELYQDGIITKDLFRIKRIGDYLLCICFEQEKEINYIES